MTVGALIAEATRRGIRFHVEGGQLGFKGPAGAMDAQLRGQLVQRKAELLQLLQAGDAAPLPRRADPAAGCPLSFGQQRLWFIDRMEGGSQYNVPAALALDGELDRTALEQALAKLVERHAILRTTYASADGEPVQRVQDAAAAGLEWIDLGGLDGAQQDAEVRRLAAAEAARPFDLEHGPVLRASVLSLAPQRHVLLVTLHHIATDGWSMGIVVREFAELYAAQVSGRAAVLPELPVQYADFAAWQRAQVDGAALERQLGYWRERLAGLPQVHSLPLDKARPAQQAFEGALFQHTVGAGLLKQLKALAAGHDATLFMVLQTAFAVLLSRWSNERDIVVGSPIAGRQRKELEGLVGLFVNTLVLRSEIDPELSFAALLAQGKAGLLDAYAHQDLPFEKLVDALNPERSLAHAPLFQLMFSMQDAAPGKLELPGLQVSSIGAQHVVAKFDLELSAGEVDGGALLLNWQYATSLFEPATVARLANSFGVLLAAIAAAPQAPVGDLSLLPSAELLQLQSWGDGGRAAEAGCLHQLFEAQAAATPQAPALAWDGQAMDYATLNAQANRVAHRLLADGLQPGDLAGLCMERSPEMVAAMLGILKAGGAFVPLDPSYPEARLAHMLQDSAVRVVLSQQRLGGRLGQAAVLCLDDASVLAGQPACNPDVAGLSASHLAYVIYTSGSTGLPKGVMVEHGSVAAHVQAVQARYGLRADDRVLMFSGLGVDAALELPLCAWLAGACVYLRSEALPLPAQLLAQCAGQGITAADLPPAYLCEMLADPVADAGYWQRSSLRLVVAGGEAFPPVLLRHWQQLGLHGRIRLFNAYGPTETTITASLYEVAPDCDAGAIPLGAPLPGRRFTVRDARGQLLPRGVAGELHIEGSSLARGYLNQSQLSAERFGTAGQRSYRTGDLVRWNAAGQLVFAGRCDDQVKLRGFRIELGEIASCLSGHGAVGEALVQLAAGRLVAYVVAAEAGWESLEQALRRHASQHLADFMLPSAYVRLDALPLLPNGKVDRRALPVPATAPAVLAAPATATEHALAAIWCRVLGLEQASVKASFFELGGNSLLAMRVMSAVAREFDLELPVRALFEHQDIASLAAHIDARRAEGGNAWQAIPPAPGGQPLALSFAQQRLWFIDQLEGAGSQYNMPVALLLEGALDQAALRSALRQLLQRHAILRTSYRAVEGEPQQYICGDDTPQLELASLEALADSQQDDELRRLAAIEAGRPFDLAQGHMLRATLLALAPQRHALLVTIHHIAADGWSMGVVVREFAELYAAAVEGRAASLPVLPVQYADFSQWQRSQGGAARLAQQLDYWRARLAGLPQVHGLPLDKARPARQQFEGALHQQLLPPALLARLQALATAHDATLFMVLHTALAVLLARWSNESDIVVGSPVAGRQHQQLEGLVGLFVNTLVLRTQVDPEVPFATLLAQGRAALLDAYAHQDLPFEQLVDALQPERSLAHTPLFQVMFSMQNTEAAELALPGLRVSGLASGHVVSKFDLELSAGETERGLALTWNYATSLFEASTIERMADGFALLLDALAEAPQQAAGALPLLTERDAALLERWNATARDYPSDACIHHLFEAQAQATPDAPALRCEGRQLSYRELNERANRIAHRLLADGLQPGELVGLCTERSLEMVAGVYGILKAGGAYVPLDPSYPAARLQYMLEDSAVRTVLTQSHLLGATAVPAQLALCLDHEHEFSGQPGGNPALQQAPGSLAYVIYTSGSTGQPKGVLCEHRGLVNRIDWMQREYRMSAADRVLQKTPYSFDVSVWELTWPFTVGACLVMARPGGHQDPSYLADTIQAEGITILHFVPSMLGAMLASGRWQECTAVRQVFCSGEALSYPLVQQFFACHRAELHNLYGPTEASIDVSYWPAAPRDGRQVVPIGRPIQNMQLHVLDAALRPVPVGVAGELHIGGIGLARGYLNRPELNAQRFIERVGADGSAERLYKTGDIARYLADGNLEYLGRADFQVKLRGLRIELGEIEAQLCAQPGVAEAAVLAQGQGDAMRLVAYVAPAALQQDEAAFVAALQSALGVALPDYMVPAAFVLLERLPLSANGKLDRKQLPQAGQGTVQARYCAPEGELETALCALWADHLGLERVGATDSYFALGGDSIRAIRLVAAMQAAGIAASVRDIFAAKTVRGLAQILDSGTAVASAGSDVAPFAMLDDGERDALAPLLREQMLEDAFPLTRLQEGMVFHSRLDAEGGTYHDVLNVRVSAALDLERFRQALEQVMAAHGMLRTVYALDGARPLQLVHKSSSAPLLYRDLRGMAPAAQGALIAEQVAFERAGAIDFARGLWKVVLLHLDDGAFQYILSFHHSMLDGWSIASLNTELFQRYQGQVPAAGAALPYRHYVWQEQQALADDAARSYWRAMLDGARLPWWSGRPAGAMVSLPVAIDAQLSARLAALAQRLGVQDRSVLLAAHMALQAMLCGQDDVTSSVVANGRPEREGGDRTLGLFLNALPVRCRLAGQSWQQLVREMDALALAMQPHRHYPLAAIQSESRLDLSGSLFNYTSFHVYDKLAGSADAAIEQSHEQNNYLFSSEFARSGSGDGVRFHLTLKADAALFGGAFGQRIAGYYARVLQALAGDSLAPALGELLGEAEMLQVRRLAQPAPQPAAQDVLAGFRMQALHRPQHAALEWDGQAYSYRQLDTLSEALAQELVQRGVGSGDVVAVCLPRGAAMVASLLAVLKAGAAYLPMDPSHPAARLEYMLADSGAALLLCAQDNALAVPAGTRRRVLDEASWPALAATGAALPGAGPLAYVIYTSGSTGQPKGVRIGHAALAAFIAGACQRAGIDQDTRWLALTTISFDIAGFELFGPLTQGGTIVLAPADGARDAAYLAAALAGGINVMQATPVSWSLLLESGWQGSARLRALAGGEPLPLELVQALAPRCGRGLYNCYGPTEATIWSHVAPVLVQDGRVLLDGLLPGYGHAVCNAALEPVPQGVIGELMLSGAALAEGYHGRDELTAGKFVQAAGGPLAGLRLYRTGDLVRRLDGERLEFLGRSDDQVKIHGYRIELGEIEQQLLACDGVKRALVVAHGAPGQQRLAAYVVAHGAPGSDLLETRLRLALREHLPAYMVPAAIVALDAFPLTPNGKVDKKALPLPGSLPGAAHCAPWNDTERALCGLWQRLLGGGAVSATADFFELGGDSLLATRMLVQLNQQFGLALGIRDIFNLRTVRELALHLDVLATRTATSSAGTAPQEEIEW